MVHVAGRAARQRKLLSGVSAEARKFHECEARLALGEREVRHIARDLGVDANGLTSFDGWLGMIRSSSTALPDRQLALRHLRRFCTVELVPLASSNDEPETPTSEDLVPLAVLKGTRGYLYKTPLQANGCLERNWCDGAVLMVRRLVELLIIEVYDRDKGKRIGEIQDANGDIVGLDELINRLMADRTFTLATETRRVLPEIRKKGNRSAHARRYSTTKQELLKVAGDLRLAVDELLHLADLR